MNHRSFLLAALALGGAPSVNAVLRFSCSELVTERLDPFVPPSSSSSSRCPQAN